MFFAIKLVTLINVQKISMKQFQNKIFVFFFDINNKIETQFSSISMKNSRYALGFFSLYEKDENFQFIGLKSMIVYHKNLNQIHCISKTFKLTLNQWHSCFPQDYI